MKSKQFWIELVLKIHERVENDRLRYGDAFIEIVYDTGGMLKSLKFDGTMMHDKVIVE